MESGYLLLLIWPVLEFVVFVVIVWMIYKWVTRFLALKEEQNDLLRQIVSKMGDKL